MRTDVRDLSLSYTSLLGPLGRTDRKHQKFVADRALFEAARVKRTSLTKRHSKPSIIEERIMNYEDFLLNELAGLSGLDEEEIRKIVKKIEEEKARQESEDDAEQRQSH